MVNYKKIEKSFYDDSSKSLNIIRAWFHNSRSRLTTRLVNKYYKSGMVLLDLGCGNVMWNSKKLPVVGVDINENFLEYSFKLGRINRMIKNPLDHTGLPNNFADIIIITEVIEHLPHLNKYLQEIFRLLKPNGVIISSVPYDTNLSLWKPLFSIQCFYRGIILGENYYREKCGHINHFSPALIKRLFNDNKLTCLFQKNHFYFTIFSVFKKIL